MKNNYALVRIPGESYLNAISSTDQAKSVDLELLLHQHDSYCKALMEIGLTVIKLPAQEEYPDGCFVEDPFVIYNGKAMKTVLGAASRQGEGDAIETVLQNFLEIEKMKEPATMDGGDVIVTEEKVLIGNSKRTNLLGVKSYKELLDVSSGIEVVAVPVKKTLHLKSAATYLDDNVMLVSNSIDKKYFEGFRIIDVDDEESYAADCLCVDGVVLIPSNHPKTRNKIEAKGFKTIELDMSEFQKADGSITCLSLIF